jgi:glycosyltransferase involved in cell wall biosynthesis
MFMAGIGGILTDQRPQHGLEVALLHNYREEQQPSMRLYAERLGQALIPAGVRVTRIRPPRIVPDPWRRRSWLWRKVDDYGGGHLVYPRLLRNLKADVVHVIDHSQGYLIGSLDPRRVVVTCHDVVLFALATGRIGGAEVPKVAFQVFRMSLELAKRAAAVVADSSQTKRDLIDLVGMDPAKITVIFPGLNQAFAPDRERGLALRRRLGWGDSPVIFQIGRTFYKNIGGVLRVLHRLRQGGLDARLARSGSPLAGEERRLAERLGLSAHVLELGPVDDADMPALYNAIDLLLFPSLYEGFGWPPLEAMASGTPVVCSRAGSLEEVVGDAALTADAEDTETLAWHAATVLGDGRVRDALIERGLAHAAGFRWERTAREMRSVYEQVAAKAS